jgi:DNA-binding helix-hairpin-helix protein with protein kinase domain
MQAAQQFREGRTWADYLRVSRCMASCIDVLNRKGCTHSDIQYHNFLVHLKTGRAVMLEADGVVVRGFLRAKVDGFPGFMAPEILASGAGPSEKTDRHSLAVLLLHTLLFRNVMNPLIEYDTDVDQSEKIGWGEQAVFSEHPSDRRNRPSKVGMPLFRRGALSYHTLGPRLEALTDRALIEGLRAPSNRPSAQEWVKALACALDEVYGCGRCRQHFIYPHWQLPPERRACPFCGERVAVPRPVVMDLLEEKQRGAFQVSGRRLVLGEGFKVFADILDPRRMPPVSRQSEPVAAQCAWMARSNRYVLVNQSDGVWTSWMADGSRGPRVGRGESVPLQPGMKLLCGDGSRLLRVVEAPE